MFCPECGGESKTGSQFCGYCGAKVRAVDVRLLSPPVPTPPPAPTRPPPAPRYQAQYEPLAYGGEETVPPAGAPRYQPASVGARFGARFIDGLVTLAISAAAAAGGLWAIWPSLQSDWDTLTQNSSSPTPGLNVALTMLILWPVGELLIALNYFAASEGSAQQTLGKRALGIYVAPERGGYGYGRAFARQLAYIITTLPLFAGVFAALADPERRTWHDRWTHTRVVQGRPQASGSLLAPVAGTAILAILLFVVVPGVAVRVSDRPATHDGETPGGNSQSTFNPGSSTASTGRTTTSLLGPAETRLITLNNADFSIDYPSDWLIDKNNEPPVGTTNLLDTTIKRGLGNNQYVIRVDIVRGGGTTASVADGALGDVRKTPSYREISSRSMPFTAGSRTYDAIYVEFIWADSKENVPLHTVDVFFTDGSARTFAVLTRAPQSDYANWSPIFERVRGSVSLK